MRTSELKTKDVLGRGIVSSQFRGEFPELNEVPWRAAFENWVVSTRTPNVEVVKVNSSKDVVVR